jgi:hypothetical protein
MVVVRETIAPRARPRARRAAHHHVAAATKKRAARRRGGGGDVSLIKIAATAVVLGNVVGKKDGVAGGAVYDLVQKLPGAKTFGGAEAVGLYCAGLHHFTTWGGKLRPWIKAAGYLGVAAAFLKLGNAGTAFKWLGGSGEHRDLFDIER